MVIIMVSAMIKVVADLPFAIYLAPIAFASMLLAILLDEGVAFISTLIVSVFAASIAGDKFGIVIVSLIGGAAGIYFVRNIRKRSQLIKAGVLVGAFKFTAICAIGLMNDLDPQVFLNEGLWGLGSGIMSAGLVMFCLNGFESLFTITTDFTLLELSALDHPILKKMVIESPGTYHHSLVIGNLAEDASDAINANSLLARVGAYYHDIGKLDKPEYFSENEQFGKSAHSKLAPSMSALVIISHVKDGIELAKKHKLPDSIKDFIAQHHGTSLIYFFYQRALENLEDDAKLKEDGFRYPGPKPQSKEAAIVLLADAVEASSRLVWMLDP